ncbi:hypothetical protein BJV82DRAFT_610432 [Fennellomyces sp. T-0311]|nr:hypothetical protein BJV82DRAFT_610432 [Fennellomyces sp. T-0311]
MHDESCGAYSLCLLFVVTTVTIQSWQFIAYFLYGNRKKVDRTIHLQCNHFSELLVLPLKL